MYRSDRIIIRYFACFRNRFFPEINFSNLYRRTFYQIFRIFVKSSNLKNQGFLQNDLIIFQFYWHGIQENLCHFLCFSIQVLKPAHFCLSVHGCFRIRRPRCVRGCRNDRYAITGFPAASVKTHAKRPPIKPAVWIWKPMPVSSRLRVMAKVSIL